MDKYDQAIEWLVEHADDETALPGCNVIDLAWDLDDAYQTGQCLFQICSPSGFAVNTPQGMPCGCLTQVVRKENTLDAWTPKLTEAIRADQRIPGSIRDISRLRGDELRTALQPFAEWQRRLDKEIRGA
jgi:hypothetical protein